MTEHSPLRMARAAPRIATVRRIETVRGLSGFMALESEWKEHFQRCAAPHQVFQSFSFLSAWAQVYGQRSELLTLVARVDGRPVLIAPLERRNRGAVRIVRPMGAPVAQFDDILVDPSESEWALPALWSALQGLDADLFEARRVRQDGMLWRLGNFPIVYEQMESPVADLGQRVDGDDPGPAYSAKDRSGYRRRLRRLGERGEVQLKSMRAGEAGAVEMAQRAVALKKTSLHNAGIYSRAIGSPAFAEFFAQLAGDPASGMLISTIELDGAPIGIDLSFLCNGGGFGHVLATDDDFQREGLGQLLVHHVFAEAKKAGAARFDLLAPADPYKMHHADATTRVESRVFAFTAAGRVIARLGYGVGLPLARKLATSAPGWAVRGPRTGKS